MGEAHLERDERRAGGLTRQADEEGEAELGPLSQRHRVRPGRARDDEGAVVVAERDRGAVVHHACVAGDLLEGGLERRAGTKRVLEKVHRTGGNGLRQVQTQRVVARDPLGQAPRLGGRGVGDARVRVVEVASPQAGEIPERSRVVTTGGHVRQQVLEDPRQDGGAPVASPDTFGGSGLAGAHACIIPLARNVNEMARGINAPGQGFLSDGGEGVRLKSGR